MLLNTAFVANNSVVVVLVNTEFVAVRLSNSAVVALTRVVKILVAVALLIVAN